MVTYAFFAKCESPVPAFGKGHTFLSVDARGETKSPLGKELCHSMDRGFRQLGFGQFQCTLLCIASFFVASFFLASSSSQKPVVSGIGQ